MPRVNVPVNIRPHLVPFLYLNFKGVDAYINGKHAKAVKISTRNNLGKLIRLLVKKSDGSRACDTTHSIYLSITEQETGTKYFGRVYGYADGRSSFLELPEEGVRMINEHLEGYFRASLMFFLLGWEAKGGDKELQKGVNHFVDKYRLLEFGFDPESLRRNFYRWKKQENRLSFLANQASNRVKNYI